jgi:hypothetical protein
MARTSTRWTLLALVLTWTTSCASPPPPATPDELPERIEVARTSPHPRLLWPGATESELAARIAADPGLAEVLDHVRQSADATLEAAPVERIQVGRRLLGVSRTVLKRVTALAFMHRLTGDPRYAARAELEMVTAAGFSDWNPSHFLDVAEMTAALALGYDWLHDALTPEGRATIRSGIVDHGLRPSLEGGWWVSTDNNWNPVCHGGLTMGALAVLEHEPELAERIVSRALEHLPRAMAEYAPDGAYPEGPSYWEYGTSFNVLLVEALRVALGTDFGLCATEGFLESSDYMLHVTGPSGLYFNYSDGGEGRSLSPTLAWFARERGMPWLLRSQSQDLDGLLGRYAPAANDRNRLLPFLLLWSPDASGSEGEPPRHFVARGTTPIATHRTGWGNDDLYLGIKAGSPGANHGHMDIGSFVLEADGVRWAIDLGSQNYNSLESRGIQLWDRGQKGRRWDVFRLSNLSHSTLVVDGKKQRVAGSAPILSSVDHGLEQHTVLDLGPVYQGQVDRAVRSFLVGPDRAVTVQDEVRALGEPTSIRWGLLTRADVDLVDPQTAVLRQADRTLTLRVVSPDAVSLRLEETATPPADFDAPNPGTRMIAFDVGIEAGAEQRITVQLSPGLPPPDSSVPRPFVERSGR